MMRLAVILLLFCYSVGNLLLPSGNISYALNLSDMYHQCSIEDTDITPADFFFEHILNLEDLIAHFEQEKEQDKPHQPAFSVNSLPVFAVTATQPLPVYHAKERPVFANRKYVIRHQPIVPQHTLSGIFRPPIV